MLWISLTFSFFIVHWVKLHSNNSCLRRLWWGLNNTIFIARAQYLILLFITGSLSFCTNQIQHFQPVLITCANSCQFLFSWKWVWQELTTSVLLTASTKTRKVFEKAWVYRSSAKFWYILGVFFSLKCLAVYALSVKKNLFEEDSVSVLCNDRNYPHLTIWWFGRQRVVFFVCLFVCFPFGLVVFSINFKIRD